MTKNSWAKQAKKKLDIPNTPEFRAKVFESNVKPELPKQNQINVGPMKQPSELLEALQGTLEGQPIRVRHMGNKAGSWRREAAKIVSQWNADGKDRITFS